MKLTEKRIALLQELKEAGTEELTVSRENKKLKPNKNTAFIIWNLPAKRTCPYATEHCILCCYARKAETCYPDCLPSREKHFLESLKDDFVNRMIYTILKIAKGTRKKEIIVRIHESGDFYNRAYVEKWFAIMRACYGINIKFIAYTKSFPFFDGVKLPENFYFRASIWDDTKPEFIEMIKRNEWPTYSAVEKFTDHDEFGHCRCDDCATCGKCWNNDYKAINCEIH